MSGFRFSRTKSGFVRLFPYYEFRFKLLEAYENAVFIGLYELSTPHDKADSRTTAAITFVTVF